MLPAACTLVAHASKASRAKRSAAGIVTPFVSCASTDHGDEQHYAAIHNNFPYTAVHCKHFSGLLYSTHFIYIIILATLYANFAIPTSTNFGQQTMAFRRCAASDAAAKHDLSNIRRCAVTISTERTTTTCACACNEPHKHYFAVQNTTAP